MTNNTKVLKLVRKTDETEPQGGSVRTIEEGHEIGKSPVLKDESAIDLWFQQRSYAYAGINREGTFYLGISIKVKKALLARYDLRVKDLIGLTREDEYDINLSALKSMYEVPQDRALIVSIWKGPTVVFFSNLPNDVRMTREAIQQAEELAGVRPVW